MLRSCDAPGIGKTFVMHEVARILQIEYADIQLSNLHSSMEFSGLPPPWKTPVTGIYAKSLSGFSKHSAIVFLDEIDKVKINSEHGSIFESLLILLEGSTCSRFRDALLDLPMNSDEIFFIATANRSAYANHNTNKKIIHIDRKSLFGNDFFDDILHDLNLSDYTMQ